MSNDSYDDDDRLIRRLDLDLREDRPDPNSGLAPLLLDEEVDEQLNLHGQTVFLYWKEVKPGSVEAMRAAGTLVEALKAQQQRIVDEIRQTAQRLGDENDPVVRSQARELVLHRHCPPIGGD